MVERGKVHTLQNAEIWKYKINDGNRVPYFLLVCVPLKASSSTLEKSRVVASCVSMKLKNNSPRVALAKKIFRAVIFNYCIPHADMSSWIHKSAEASPFLAQMLLIMIDSFSLIKWVILQSHLHIHKLLSHKLKKNWNYVIPSHYLPRFASNPTKI